MKNTQTELTSDFDNPAIWCVDFEESSDSSGGCATYYVATKNSLSLPDMQKTMCDGHDVYHIESIKCVKLMKHPKRFRVPNDSTDGMLHMQL